MKATILKGLIVTQRPLFFNPTTKVAYATTDIAQSMGGDLEDLEEIAFLDAQDGSMVVTNTETEEVQTSEG